MSSRTISEIVHETAASILPEIEPGKRVAVVIASERTPSGGMRTVWRFINCDDRDLQVSALRSIASMIEGKLGKLETPS